MTHSRVGGESVSEPDRQITVTVAGIVARTGRSRAVVFRWTQDNHFPAQVRDGFWDWEDVKRWMSEWLPS